MAIPSVGGGYQIGDGNLNEVQLGALTVATATDTATLTVAQLQAGLIAATPTAAATYTTPTAAAIDTAFPAAKVGSYFDFIIVNKATTAAYDITMAAGTGVTLVGGLEVSSNNAVTDRSSGTFRAIKTGAGAWTIYRIAG
jgi:hypothetical protein